MNLFGCSRIPIHKFNKALFIQDRNPGVPGVMYKVARETEEKRKSLKNARELWIATVDVT